MLDQAVIPVTDHSSYSVGAVIGITVGTVVLLWRTVKSLKRDDALNSQSNQLIKNLLDSNNALSLEVKSLREQLSIYQKQTAEQALKVSNLESDVRTYKEKLSYSEEQLLEVQSKLEKLQASC